MIVINIILWLSLFVLAAGASYVAKRYVDQRATNVALLGKLNEQARAQLPTMKGCPHPSAEIDDVIVLLTPHVASGEMRETYVHRFPNCYGVILDGAAVAHRIDIIADYMRTERKDIADAMRPWFDLRPLEKGESPILAAIAALKEQFDGFKVIESNYKKEVDKLRTLMWGKTCVYCGTPNSAVGRVPDGRPICKICHESGAWESEQDEILKERAIAEV